MQNCFIILNGTYICHLSTSCDIAYDNEHIQLLILFKMEISLQDLYKLDKYNLFSFDRYRIDKNACSIFRILFAISVFIAHYKYHTDSSN